MANIQGNDLIEIARSEANKTDRKAKKKKAELKSAGRKLSYEDMPAKMLSAVRDKVTGKIYIGKSGKPYSEELHSEIEIRRPDQSLMPWPIKNCAEIKACNDALQNRENAKMEDLEIATVIVRNGKLKERCANCKITTAGATVFTDGDMAK